MNLEFIKQNNLYVAEFEATSNFNLHVERKNKGYFSIAQRGSQSGQYAYIDEENYDSKKVIDVDVLGEIYPKYIKVTSASKPIFAEVNFDGEGGGIDPDDPESEFYVEYLDASFLQNEDEKYLYLFYGLFEIKIINSSDGEIKIIPAIVYMLSGVHGSTTQVSYMPNKKLYMGGIEMTVKDILNANGILEVYNSITRITKEEFYNTTA